MMTLPPSNLAETSRMVQRFEQKPDGGIELRLTKLTNAEPAQVTVNRRKVAASEDNGPNARDILVRLLAEFPGNPVFASMLKRLDSAGRGDMTGGETPPPQTAMPQADMPEDEASSGGMVSGFARTSKTNAQGETTTNADSFHMTRAGEGTVSGAARA